MRILHFPKRPWLNRLGLALTSILAIVAGFAITSVLLTVLLVAALIGGGWLWWQYRRMTQALRTAPPDFIDAEYTVESDPSLQRRLAAKPEPEQPSSQP
ncbi:MAG: hypothetical protein U1F42_06710 [Candidatus Competibacteraceae bacterium]